MTRLPEPTLEERRRPRRAPEQAVRVGAVTGGSRGGKAGRVGAAVVKVCGWRHSAGAARSTLKYVLTKADRAVDDWGQPVASAREVTETWHLRDDDGCTAVHMVFSLPNQDPRAEWLAAQAAAQELFHDSPHVCALHTDTEHPHVHVIVRSRDYRGRKLRIDREALKRYREVLARAGREQGVRVEARTYEVPTRLRDKLRGMFRPEPVERVLDRACAVLREPAEATPSQMARSVRVLKRHREHLATPHRSALIAAAGAFEQDPALKRHARTLCKVALSGERGARFRARRERRQALDTLATAARPPEALELAQADAAGTESVPAVSDPARVSEPPLELALGPAGAPAVAKVNERAAAMPSVELALGPAGARAVVERTTARPARRVEFTLGPAGARQARRTVARTPSASPVDLGLGRAGAPPSARLIPGTWELARPTTPTPREPAESTLELGPAGRARRPVRTRPPQPPVTPPTEREIRRATKRLIRDMAELDQAGRDRAWKAAAALSAKPEHAKTARKLTKALRATMTDHERTRAIIERALGKLEPAASSLREQARAVRALRVHEASLTLGDREQIRTAARACATEPGRERLASTLERLQAPAPVARTLRERMREAIASRSRAGRAARDQRAEHAVAELNRAVKTVTRPYEPTVTYHRALRPAAAMVVKHARHLTDEHCLRLALGASFARASGDDQHKTYGKTLERLLSAEAPGRAYWERWQRKEPLLSPAQVSTAMPAQVNHAVVQHSAWLRTDTDRTRSLTMTRELADALSWDPRYAETSKRLTALVERYQAVERAVGVFQRAAEHSTAELGEAMRTLRKHRALLNEADRARVRPAREVFAQRPELRSYTSVVDWLATPTHPRPRPQQRERTQERGRAR